MLRIAGPRHRYQLTRVDHGAAGFALETDQAVRVHRHAGELVVLGRGEPDLADPADHHRDRAGLADERLEQGHGASRRSRAITSSCRYQQDAPQMAAGSAARLRLSGLHGERVRTSFLGGSDRASAAVSQSATREVTRSGWRRPAATSSSSAGMAVLAWPRPVRKLIPFTYMSDSRTAGSFMQIPVLRQE